MDTISEQAAALRILAKQLTLLADQVEAGHAEYLEGTFNYEISHDSEDVPNGALMRAQTLPSGEVHFHADMRFKTGHRPLSFQAGDSPA